MSSSLIKGSGEVSATTQFQLLDPAIIHGATSFFYDFYLKGASAGATGIWQLWDGAVYQDFSGASGVAAEDEVEWLRRAEVDATSEGQVQLERTAGDLEYWYALSGGGPTIHSASGSVSSDTEFFLEAGRIYTITSDGTHTWKFWNGSAWVAFTDGTQDGFSFDAPSHRRIQVVPTGAVNFAITSRKM